MTHPRFIDLLKSCLIFTPVLVKNSIAAKTGAGFHRTAGIYQEISEHSGIAFSILPLFLPAMRARLLSGYAAAILYR